MTPTPTRTRQALILQQEQRSLRLDEYGALLVYTVAARGSDAEGQSVLVPDFPGKQQMDLVSASAHPKGFTDRTHMHHLERMYWDTPLSSG